MTRRQTRRTRRTRRALLRWVPVVFLVLFAVASVAIAFDLSSRRVPDQAEPLGVGALTTPVLSARRVPLVTSAPIAGRRLVAALDGFVAEQDASTCLEVRVGHDIIYTHDAEEPVVPASTQKLLTAAGSFLVLGPDATFETVAAGGPIGADGVLSGDLFLIGGGDPILETAKYAESFRRQPQIHTQFEALADQLVAAGLRQVTGRVVGDETRFDAQRRLPIPEVWMPEDIVRDVTGPLSALYVNDGFMGYPGDGEGTTTFDEALDPSVHAATVLIDLLLERGVVIDGEPATGDAPEGIPTITSISSPPLSEVVAEMLQESDNSTAELLLKEIGRVSGAGGTSAAGIEALREVLVDAGFTLDGTTLLDGSGVSNGNRTTCRLLAEVLTDPRIEEPVVDGLAVAGEKGTLANRYRDTLLAGNLRAKTGSLRIVTSLAGQIDTAHGGHVQFSYVANVPPGSSVTPALVEAQEKLGYILLAHPDVPDMDLLGPR